MLKITRGWSGLVGFTALLGLALSSTVFAGGDSSSGGGAMVCRDAQGKIVSAELLDLWEIQFRDDGARVVRSNDSVDSQIEQAINRVKHGYGPDAAQELRAKVDFVRSKVKRIQTGVEISPPSDALNDLFQSGCKLEGAALFNDRKSILYVNSAILDAMPSTDQAALWIHEAVYQTRRTVFAFDPAQIYPSKQLLPVDTTSIATREYVGTLFSDKAIQSPVVEGDSYLLCSGDTYTSVFMETDAGYKHYQYRMLGEKSTRATLRMFGAALADMMPIRSNVVDKSVSKLLRLVDRKISDDAFASALYAIARCKPYSDPKNCLAGVEKGKVKFDKDYMTRFDFGSEFIFGAEGSTPDRGVIMTVSDVQTLYAENRNPEALFEVHRSRWTGSVKSITRNENVEPLCKRFSTKENPLPWAN